MSSQSGFLRIALLALALAFHIGPARAQSTPPQVVVNGVTFQGNYTYTASDLSGLIASEIGKPMTLKDIQGLAARVEAFYHDAGYPLVKVVVPQQTFADGTPVKLVVLEGQLGEIRIEGNQRYASRRILDALAAADVHRDEPVRLDRVERALTRLNRQSGIEAAAALKPGARQGYTDLIIKVEEAPRVTGALELNNYGSKDTGRYRVVPSITLQNLTGRGDNANLIGMQSIGDGDAWFAYADYVTPVNARGTSVQVYGSTGNVNVGRDFEVLEVEGDSTGLGVGVLQDQILSARSVLTYSAWLEGTDLDQDMLGVRIAQDRIRKLRVGVALDRTDLSGRSLMSVDLHHGLGESLGGMDDNSTLSSRAFAGADNDFTKVTMDLARIQRLNARTLLIPRLYGQYAFDPLVSSEQWAIGGANSVKGHPPSIYSGDSGFTASLEARYDLFADDSRYQLIGQLSHGRLYIKKPFYDQDDEQDISGVSLGLLARPWKPIEVRLDWGLPLGTETGDNNYFYAQARYRF
tara:strand:+ start:6272 stop:7834 length:1563 start_codon:yes stop_codon:yes gene_type:complete